MTGWSVQYASTGTGSGAVFGTPARFTILSGTIQPGQYYLSRRLKCGRRARNARARRGRHGAGQRRYLGGIAIGSSGGQVALVNNSASLSGACPLTNCAIVDFVGWNTSIPATRAPARSLYQQYDVGFPHLLLRGHGRQTPPISVGHDPGGSLAAPHNSASPIAPHNHCAARGSVRVRRGHGHVQGYCRWSVPELSGAGQERERLDNVTTGTGGNHGRTRRRAAAGDNGTQYRVVVSNDYGPSATSDPAAVVIDPATTMTNRSRINQIYGRRPTGLCIKRLHRLYNKGTSAVDVTDGQCSTLRLRHGLEQQDRPAGLFSPALLSDSGGATNDCDGQPCGVPLPVRPTRLGQSTCLRPPVSWRWSRIRCDWRTAHADRRLSRG